MRSTGSVGITAGVDAGVVIVRGPVGGATEVAVVVVTVGVVATSQVSPPPTPGKQKPGSSLSDTHAARTAVAAPGALRGEHLAGERRPRAPDVLAASLRENDVRRHPPGGPHSQRGGLVIVAAGTVG